MRPGRRVRAAPPQADLSPGTGRRRGPGTGCECSALCPCLAAMPRSAPYPCRSGPGSRRPPGPVPLPGAPERGQASAAGAGAPRGSRRHGGSGAPALPPPPPLSRAQPSPAAALPASVCGERGGGRQLEPGEGDRQPGGKSRPLCAVSPRPALPLPPARLEIPGEARCSPGSSQSPRAGPA